MSGVLCTRGGAKRAPLTLATRPPAQRHRRPRRRPARSARPTESAAARSATRDTLVPTCLHTSRNPAHAMAERETRGQYSATRVLTTKLVVSRIAKAAQPGTAPPGPPHLPDAEGAGAAAADLVALRARIAAQDDELDRQKDKVDELRVHNAQLTQENRRLKRGRQELGCDNIVNHSDGTGPRPAHRGRVGGSGASVARAAPAADAVDSAASSDDS